MVKCDWNIESRNRRNVEQVEVINRFVFRWRGDPDLAGAVPTLARGVGTLGYPPPSGPGQGTPHLDVARVSPVWTWLGYPPVDRQMDRHVSKHYLPIVLHDKKVLLHECKRHTTRHVASPWGVPTLARGDYLPWLGGGLPTLAGGGYPPWPGWGTLRGVNRQMPVKTVSSPILRMQVVKG